MPPIGLAQKVAVPPLQGWRLRLFENPRLTGVLPKSGRKLDAACNPLLSERGGCASRKCCEATAESADGVVRNGLTTPSAPIKGCLRRYFLRSRPPLL